jgi:hypothetical protein
MNDLKNRLVFLGLITIIASMFNNCTKEDTPTKTKKNPVITWDNPAEISYGTPLSSAQLNATADIEGTFVYTPAIGTKLEVGTNQDLKVDFTPKDVKIIM